MARKHRFRATDVASGPGSTALLLAQEFGVTVEGVDLAEGAVRRAGERSTREGFDGAVRFSVGDAERLPVEDGSVEAIICECALCTFPDKRAAVSEFARVLRPGGRIGIADIVLDPERLDPALRSLAGRLAWPTPAPSTATGRSSRPPGSASSTSRSTRRAWPG